MARIPNNLDKLYRPKITVQDLCPGDMLITPVQTLPNRTYVILSCTKPESYEFAAATIIEIEKDHMHHIRPELIRLKLLIKNRLLEFNWSSDYEVTTPIFRLRC